MDKEKERRIEENQNSKLSMSDEKAAVLEEISRKVSKGSISYKYIHVELGLISFDIHQ